MTAQCSTRQNGCGSFGRFSGAKKKGGRGNAPAAAMKLVCPYLAGPIRQTRIMKTDILYMLLPNLIVFED
jgi:hypothetical protein